MEFQNKLVNVEDSLITAKAEYEKPFNKEDELQKLLLRQQELNDILYEKTDSKDSVDENIDEMDDERNDEKLADNVSCEQIGCIQRRKFAI